MIENNSQNQEIKRYLYLEMTEEEHSAMEEKLFADDTLFFAISDLENELVDQYVRKQLTGEELTRFERSLEKLPKRRAKVANAVALQTFVAEEREESAPAVVAVSQTFWQKLSEFFTIKTPAFGLAIGGLLVLFTLASVVLFLENRRQSNELANLQNNQNGNRSQREIELQNQIANAQKRESELQVQIDKERETSGDLTDELEIKKAQLKQVQSEIERLRKESIKIPVPTPKPKEQTPTIASLSLKPTIITRDPNPTAAQPFTIERGTQRLAIRLTLPAEAKKEERYSVKLNEKPVAQNLAVRVAKDGQKSVQLTVSTSDVIDGVNRLTVIDATGNDVSKANNHVQRGAQFVADIGDKFCLGLACFFGDLLQHF